MTTWSASLDTTQVVGAADEAVAALERVKKAAKEAGDALDKATSKAAASKGRGGGGGADPGKARGPSAKAAGDTSKAEERAQKAKERGDTKEVRDSFKRAAKQDAERKKREAKEKREREKAEKEKEREKKDRESATLDALSRTGPLGAKASSVANMFKVLQTAGPAGAAAAAAAVGVVALTGAVEGLVSLASKATGVGSFSELTDIAIGPKGLAGIQVAQVRTNLGFRQMFRGVDSSPLVRATERFSANFTAQTVTGKALGDILSRAYGGAFVMIERLEPIATGVLQGMVLGALKVENAWLRLQIAAYPIVAPLLKAVGATDALAAAGDIAVQPFQQIADTIRVIELAFKGIGKLKEMGLSSGLADIVLPESIGSALNLYNALGGDAAAGDGAAVGTAAGEGIIAGLDAQEGPIFDAGMRAAIAAIKGAKAGADVRSPSRKMRREVGRQMGVGVALGMEDEAPRIQRTAAASLVPDPASIPGLAGRGGSGGGAITGPLLVIEKLIVQGTDDMQERVEDALDAVAARTIARFGLALSTGS